MSEPRQNWARNFTYAAARWHYPKSLEQVQELVARSRKVKALGTRHSFNNIADTTEDLISLDHFDRVVALDRARRMVTVEAGMRYGQPCHYLHSEGFALHNLASLPHISIIGACATATHGSGEQHGNLATTVSALEIVTANGEVISLTREHNGDKFHGAVVGLGGLGVVTKLTLDLLPTFDLRQYVYENLPLAQLENHFDAIQAGAYSVSLFTNWQDARINQIWLKQRVDDHATFTPEPELFGPTLAREDRHPITGISAINCTKQMGVVGPWYERLPHFRMDFTPSSGEELQSEYFVPRAHALAAIHAVAQLREHLAPLLQICEVRTIAADRLWLSPCYQQACVALHFTWKKNWPEVQKLLPQLEARLAPFEARPHWGKLFTLSHERLHALYKRMPDFQSLLHAFDPQGKFRNAFLDDYIFATK